MRIPRRPALAALALPFALAGCARHREPVAAIAAAPPPPRPVLARRYASVTPPPEDAAGRYRTINAGIDPVRTVWHVRAALNVAAIGCRGPGDAGTIAAYNAMLTGKKALLAEANRTFQVSFRTPGGGGEAAADSYMTRLYNFFAMPAAKPGFCAAAATLAPEAAAITPADFTAFAARALPALEAPFLDAYRAVDTWRTASADWDARYATAPVSEGGAPRLAYADLGGVIGWAPQGRERLASR